MTLNGISARDEALREHITELCVHIPCGRLRGPVGGRWQSCPCEDTPENWEGCDVSREQDLCVICLRATAGGTSRWAWLACENCRRANNAVAKMYDDYGDRSFALTRYSLTNGTAVTGRPRLHEAGQVPAGVQEYAAGDDRVRRWCESEYPRMAANFDPQADVPLRIWQQQWPPSIEASVKAYGRLLGHVTPSSNEGPADDSAAQRSETRENAAATGVAVRERLTELCVHIPCGRVRGPTSGRWQSCPCEDVSERWEGFDVSQECDLCIICVRGVAGGTSRWAWLGCDACRAVNDVIRAKTGKSIPLGRHSVMNGSAIHLGASPERQREQAARLAQHARDQQDLFNWQAEEFRRLAGKFPSGDDIPLTVWQRELPPSRDCSIDAMIRLTQDDGFLREIFT